MSNVEADQTCRYGKSNSSITFGYLITLAESANFCQTYASAAYYKSMRTVHQSDNGKALFVHISLFPSDTSVQRIDTSRTWSCALLNMIAVQLNLGYGRSVG